MTYLSGELSATLLFMLLYYRKLFNISEASRPKTRGHCQKLVKKRSRLELRKKIFSQRVVNTWNRLPHTVVDAESVNSFKNKLDKFDKYW